jgi:Tfp pilus assembly protein PilN
MINLLPPEEKRQLRAARSNTLLIRYNILLLGVVAFMGISIAVTYVFLSASQQTAKQTIAENDAKVKQFNPIKEQAELFRQHLTTAKQILDNEITYSKAVVAIARLIPSGVVLDNLSLDSQTFGTETALVAQAKDYNSALALKDSFEKSPLLSDVHFDSITSGGSNSDYPVTVNLSITIKKDAAK